MKLRYSVKVYDKDGKLVKRVEGESHSLLANFIKILRGLLSANAGVYTVPVVDVTGATRSFYCTHWSSYKDYFYPMRADGGDDSTHRGIVVGTGTTPPSPDDYALESMIPHGTSAGTLDYEETVYEDVVTSGNITSFNVVRMFINRTETPITVSEIGLIVWNYVWDNYTIEADYRYLIARDVLSPPVEVPGYGSIAVTYTFYVTT